MSTSTPPKDRKEIYMNASERRMISFSKIIVLSVMMTYFYGVAFGSVAVLKASELLSYFLGYIGAPVASALTFYVWKARSENIAKTKHGSFTPEGKWDFSKFIIFGVMLTFFYGIVIGSIVTIKDPAQAVWLLSYIGGVIAISLPLYLWKSKGEHDALDDILPNNVNIFNNQIDTGGIINTAIDKIEDVVADASDADSNAGDNNMSGED